MTAEVQIDGLKGILDAMAKLDDKVQRKAVYGALRDGAKPIRDAARRNAQAIDDPTTSEKIAGQISTRALSKKTTRRLGADAGVGVGVLRPHGNRKDLTKDEYLAGWFVEEGTSHVPARPFMRPAAESNQQAALSAIVASLQKSIFKE